MSCTLQLEGNALELIMQRETLENQVAQKEKAGQRLLEVATLAHQYKSSMSQIHTVSDI